MQHKTLKSVFVALCAAIISAGCFIAIPVGPGGIPIVLQNMLVVLAACTLGGPEGAASTGLFILAGALGLPIFSGGKGGMAVLLGPTGGFIMGYFLSALLAGFIAGHPIEKKNSKKTLYKIKIIIAITAGFISLYIPGILWFMAKTQATFPIACTACLIPFIPGDVIKLVITVPLTLFIRPIAGQYLYHSN